MPADRERQITTAFVALANELASDYDMVDLLTGLTADCARLLDVSAAGLLLADGRGVLHLVAASSERTRSLELFQLQRHQGPCLDCFRTKAPVLVADLHEELDQWPEFAPAALATGFASVHALPMRLRDQTLGTLGLFSERVGLLDDDDVNLGQALAHVACVAIANDRTSADQHTLTQQLQRALTSRVIVEQAKGLIAQTGRIAVDQAFEALRSYSRGNGLRLTEVAAEVVERRLPATTVLEHARAAGARTPSGSLRLRTSE